MSQTYGELQPCGCSLLLQKYVKATIYLSCTQARMVTSLWALTWMAQDNVPIASLADKGSVADTGAADHAGIPYADLAAQQLSDSSHPTQTQDVSQRVDANMFSRAAQLKRRQLDEEDFWSHEEETVARINAVLNPTSLLSGNLARLRCRIITV